MIHHDNFFPSLSTHYVYSTHEFKFIDTHTVVMTQYFLLSLSPLSPGFHQVHRPKMKAAGLFLARPPGVSVHPGQLALNAARCTNIKARATRGPLMLKRLKLTNKFG